MDPFELDVAHLIWELACLAGAIAILLAAFILVVDRDQSAP